MDDKDNRPSEEHGSWYVVHTYSGYENKVKDKIEMMIENEQDENVFDVRVPMEKYTEVKNNERIVKERKVLPGYVLVKMNITPASWYLIRNTHGVTGFVGPGSDPTPLTKREIAKFGVREQVHETSVDVKPGDKVEVIFGPFTGFVAEVEEVSAEKRTLKGLINMFGRDTAVELSFDDIETV
uniref:transcription termination/antitermination protein NusG n=1 Tax=Ndongobacter massiliensis TaxID=1871025 RepID=UPI0009312783|nr:transcription termination/antitermination protein NusG [Ndongobacter massiliensis]